MIQYETKDTLEVGDIVEVTLYKPNIHTAYFVAKKLTRTLPCSEQCDMHTGLRCNGHCYRYKNNDICFAAIEKPDDDFTIVETEFAANARIAAEQMREEMR